MKVWYYRKAKSRCFEPGDRVLILFPVVGNPLQAKYSGPYKVVKKTREGFLRKNIVAVAILNILIFSNK